VSAIDRRRFIKLTAVTGATAALARCGSPENQIVRFIPDDELVPGVATWKPSICPLCAAGCGVIVRVMEGDVEVVRNGQAGVVRMGLAKKLEGDPDDPISQGKLCARGQAAIQITYHPDRLQQPMKRVGERGSGRFEPVTWDEAIADVVKALDELAASGNPAGLAFVGRPRGPRRHGVAARVLERFGAPPPAIVETFSDEVLRAANLRSFGAQQLPTVDLAETRYLVSFAADFLGTWNSPVAQGAAYGRMRQGRPGVGAKFVQVESHLSLTGASANEWVPIRPGTDGVLALGLAHVMLRDTLRPASAAGRAGAQIDGWSAGLPDFTPARVEDLTGVPAARVERLAREMAAHSPSAAIVGGAALAHTNGMFHALAVNALNALAGSVGQPGGLVFTEDPPAVVSRTTLATLIETAPRVLLLDEANLLYAAPASLKARGWLARVPLVVSFGSFIDDTSVMADLLLPDHSFLEAWVDRHAESGAVKAPPLVAGPAMRPLHQTRSTPDVLLEIARRLAKPLPDLPQSFEEFVQQAPPGRSSPQALKPSGPQGGGRVLAEAIRYTPPEFAGDPATFPLHFVPYVSQALLDGSVAHLPWLQEMPDPLTSAMWSSWVELNPQTAARLGIANGDLVEVTSSEGRLQAPALLLPSVAPDVVAMPVGQGHDTFTRYASGRGANPLTIAAPLAERETGAPAWAATRVRVARAADADGSLILFAGATRERPDDLTGR
jgi:anaerobic selenocysteine-containing dehydrogenase